VEIRSAQVEDLDAIAEIYNHYVLNGFATFDERPTSVEERREWFETFAETGRYRVFVADDGNVRGYGCSIPYRAHASFTETVELSVYISPEHTGNGLGSLLYERLLGELAGERVHRVLAGIALPNDASVRLHRRFGFTEVGVFDEYAQKWGRYISSVWMQLNL
jgi:phosphinothricin acetyltransferase